MSEGFHEVLRDGKDGHRQHCPFGFENVSFHFDTVPFHFDTVPFSFESINFQFESIVFVFESGDDNLKVGQLLFKLVCVLLLPSSEVLAIFLLLQLVSLAFFLGCEQLVVAHHVGGKL